MRIGRLWVNECNGDLATVDQPPFGQHPIHPTQFNIEAITKMEEEALNRRTPTEQVSDATVKLIGSTAFLLLQVLLILAWSAINLNLLP
ncbi:MAG: hypothetical protein WCA91_23585 [Candidatus Acidiferrales bacterium]